MNVRAIKKRNYMDTNSGVLTFSKQFKHITTLGSGGGGQAELVRDESVGMLFVLKQYKPQEGNENLFNYDRFKQEAIILYNLTHDNIVRIYNFYEYPNGNVAYIQMEYVDGKPIGKCVGDTSLDWNKIFKDGISAFCTLEENGILHRDIRSNNIMIDKNGNIKIIDFGFGKEVCNGNDGTNKNSACLNWEAPKPQELMEKNKYNHATDIYFLGHLFDDIIDKMDNFKYHNIVKKMIKDNESERYASFFDIYSDIESNVSTEQLFCEEDVKVYQDITNQYEENIKICQDVANKLDNILVKPCNRTQMQSRRDIEDKGSTLVEDFILENSKQHNVPFFEIYVDIDSNKSKEQLFTRHNIKEAQDIANKLDNILAKPCSRTQIQSRRDIEDKESTLVEDFILENSKQHNVPFFEIDVDIDSNKSKEQLFTRHNIKEAQDIANKIGNILVKLCNRMQMQSRRDIEDKESTLVEDFILENSEQHNVSIFKIYVDIDSNESKEQLFMRYNIKEAQDIANKINNMVAELHNRRQKQIKHDIGNRLLFFLLEDYIVKESKQHSDEIIKYFIKKILDND